MIDRVYRTVQHLTNIENRGYLTPTEFNTFAHLAQNEIIEQYFTDYNFYETAKSSGKIQPEHANLAKHFAERINRLSAITTITTPELTGTVGVLELDNPDLLYRVNNITLANGIPVEEEHHDHNRYAQLSPLARSNEARPTYIRRGDTFVVSPSTITTATLDYIARPLPPKWTYVSVGATGNTLFNSSASDFQDFVIHAGDETEITVKILGYVGISIRDAEVIQAAQAEMAQDKQAENKV